MEQQLKIRRATYHLWTFATSKIISSFGAQVYAFAVSLYILKLTGSATNFALNLICSVLPRTLLAPVAGYAADNFSRKKIVILAQIGTSCALLGLLIVNHFFGLSLVALYMTTCLLSIASTFSSVAFSSSITGLVDEKRIQRAMSLNQMSISLAAIGSPIVGGVLYAIISLREFLLIYLAASIIAVILESTMNFGLFAKRQERKEDAKRESFFENMKAGIAYIRQQKVILTIMSIALVTNFLLSSNQVGFSYILIEKLNIASEHYGMTEAAAAIGMLLFSIYFSVAKELKYPVLVAKYGILAMAVLNMALAFPLLLPLSYLGNVVFYIVIMFAFGCIAMVVNTPIGVMMQKTIDDDYKGRAFSVLETISMGLMPVGTILFGLLYDLFPAQWILAVSSLLLIIFVLSTARTSIIYMAHPELAQKRLKNKPEAVDPNF